MTEPTAVELQEAARYVAEWAQSDFEMYYYIGPSAGALSPLQQVESHLYQWNEALHSQRARRTVYAAARAAYDREYPRP